MVANRRECEQLSVVFVVPRRQLQAWVYQQNILRDRVNVT
jgi:hypothetical protein